MCAAQACACITHGPCHAMPCLQTAAGHGKPINDVAVHPQRPQLFLTASDDYSLRLWNFKWVLWMGTMRWPCQAHCSGTTGQLPRATPRMPKCI